MSFLLIIYKGEVLFAYIIIEYLCIINKYI